MKRWILPLIGLLALFVAFAITQLDVIGQPAIQAQANIGPTFSRLSAPEDLELPSTRTQQAASMVFDADNDGDLDFIIGSRSGSSGPYLALYLREGGGWQRYVIENQSTQMSVGGTPADIDGDGDLDFVMGGGTGSNEVWWWENPYPDFDNGQGWTRRFVKRGGEDKHHDQLFGDFDGDGKPELVFWNQYAYSLMLAEIPADPKSVEAWDFAPIWQWEDGQDGIRRHYVEGLAKADMDGDGVEDLLGGGRWFKYQGGRFIPEIIDNDYAFGRMVAGQLVPGGRPEVVMSLGDAASPVEWYQWDGSAWVGTRLGDFDHVHSLQLGDINQDGHLDIFAAEMRQVKADDLDNPRAFMGIFYGDSQGNFTRADIASGEDNHESLLADLDGDGDLDILAKPFEYQTPALDIWLNNGDFARLDLWERHVIDEARDWTSLFIQAVDLDEDGHADILTGGWWYRNPGPEGGAWERREFGGGLNNTVLVHDFDGDGDDDIFGQGWKTTQGPATPFAWAENLGGGNFQVHAIGSPNDDFLQGAALYELEDGRTAIALSWHNKDTSLQSLAVPDNPAAEKWQLTDLAVDVEPLYEDLSAGDIDGDGRTDLLLGHIWLRNTGSGWEARAFHDPGSGEPDRNLLVDMNDDGKLDALLGYERDRSGDTFQPATLAWYEQAAEGDWTERIIADPAIKAPMSLDAADLDGDGDQDVVAGEHDRDNPDQASLYVFENLDGRGLEWYAHLVHTGDEHHQGAQLADIDGDGDLDILSIGWDHSRVLLYENLSPTKEDRITPLPEKPAARRPSILTLFIQLFSPAL